MPQKTLQHPLPQKNSAHKNIFHLTQITSSSRTNHLAPQKNHAALAINSLVRLIMFYIIVPKHCSSKTVLSLQPSPQPFPNPWTSNQNFWTFRKYLSFVVKLFSATQKFFSAPGKILNFAEKLFSSLGKSFSFQDNLLPTQKYLSTIEKLYYAEEESFRTKKIFFSTTKNHSTSISIV